ncbi:PepSY domain-containing protein [Blastococcus sp. VKM Ac-2987]|uniref:PepSY domain-containing protein n=1 Tax=Blastococcus sp. VKM Ac-2987 TaxID=3004141 RepID=UPI0022AB9421|nr:PepSY domain-containing protein [Blastococcus sp. VKM Ac-2987]MCZ2858890.1 PepSY domain-containing protein [Blastococcus sp. VKM Ac-2987]
MRIGKRTAVITASTAVVLAAAGGVAVATVGGEDGDDLTRPGTVAVDGATLPEDDVAEREALAELATVAEDDAAEAAVESLGGGEVLGAELEDEDGYVVWEIEVRADDGTVHEVTVDAGDAAVLGTEVEDDDDDDGDID